MTIEVTPEPLVSEDDLYRKFDGILPLVGVDLAGLPGGRFKNRRELGGRRHYGSREFVYGDDAADIDHELTAEDPERRLMVRTYSEEIRPFLWIATDMLRQHQTGVDGYYDKRGLALSAVYTLLKTAGNAKNSLPAAVVAANDLVIYNEDRPKLGGRHVMSVAEKLSEMSELTSPLPPLGERPLLSELLKFIGDKASHRLVAVVSDFRSIYFTPDDSRDNWKAALDSLADRENELIAVEVTSPEDNQMAEGLETINHSPKGRVWSGKKGRAYRKQYQENAIAQQRAIDEALEDVGAIHIRLRTDDPHWQTHFNSQMTDPRERVYPSP